MAFIVEPFTLNIFTIPCAVTTIRKPDTASIRTGAPSEPLSVTLVRCIPLMVSCSTVISFAAKQNISSPEPMHAVLFIFVGPNVGPTDTPCGVRL